MSKKNRKNKKNHKMYRFEKSKPNTISLKIFPPTQEEYMKQIGISRIEKSIDELSNMDFSKATDADIHQKLMNIFGFNYDNLAHMMPMQVPTCIIPENAILFRVRTHDSLIEKNEDMWFPPAKVIKRMGRLNDINEPILYIADKIFTALKETRINIGEEFYLLFYKVTKPINLISIYPAYGNDSKYKEVEKLVGTFLTREFSRLVPDTENNRYKVSNAIGKFFFDYKHLGYDGWLYPSAVSENEKCIALDHRKCTDLLEFLFVCNGKMETETDYTLENPKILNIQENRLVPLVELVRTGEINNYGTNKISIISQIWRSFRKIE
jgi:hypothetical protein